MIKYLLLLIATTAFAQDFTGILVPYRKGAQWGYADTNGKILVEPQYSRVAEEGIRTKGTTEQFQVYKSGKSGVIDATGKSIVPVEFDSVYLRGINWESHLYLVQRSGLWGMYSMDGKLSIPVQYDAIQKTYGERDGTPEGKTFIVKKGKQHLVIGNENKVLAGDLEEAEVLRYDGVRLKKGGKYALFNIRESKAVTPFEYDTLMVIEIDDYSRTKPTKIFYGTSKGKMYLLDVDGNRQEVAEAPYLSESNGWNIMQGIPEFNGFNTEKVITPQDVSKAIYTTKIEEKDGYSYSTAQLKLWPYSGNFIKDPKKELIGFYSGGFVPPVYSKIVLFENEGPVVLYKGSKAGLYSTDTKTMQLEPAYDAIHQAGRIFILEKNKKTGIFDDFANGLKKGDAGTVFIEPEYDRFVFCNQYYTNTRPTRAVFAVYKFILKEKICSVGMNGVKFYED
jgi:hypothetical protein